jgi:heptosyltransferase III
VPDERRQERLAILHQGALGDFLLALPIFEGIHQLFPGSLIDFCCRLEHAELLRTKSYFGTAHSSDSSTLALLYHDEHWRKVQLPPFLASAHHIFIFGQATGRILANRLAQLTNSPVSWLRSFPDECYQQPISFFLLKQLRQQGLEVSYSATRIDPLPSEILAIEGLLGCAGCGERQPVAIHPGSGGRKKIWPLQKWWSLLRWIQSEYDHPVVLLLGPADVHLKSFAEQAQEHGAYLLENITLQRLCALFHKCRLYIGNDSGVTHLAAVAGAPTIAIFGPTLPEVWAPRGGNVHVWKSCWNESENMSWSSELPDIPVDDEIKMLVQRLLTG